MAAKIEPKYCKIETVSGDVPYFVRYMDERDETWIRAKAHSEALGVNHYSITPFPLPEKVK